MRAFVKPVIAMFGAALLATSFLGCGSASNNDQGASFSLNSFTVNDDAPVPFLEEDETNSSTGAVLGTISLTNAISTQGVRVQRIFLSYSIPGASVVPPSTSVASNLLLGPGDPSINSTTSDLPPQFDSVEPNGSVTFPAITNGVRTFLAFNRVSLPELPFEMEVTAIVRGVTTSGDVLESNAATYTVSFTPDAFIPPVDGGVGGGAVAP